jgi:LysM repeat protein/ABC-type branched-subunit amino acid transport system substrate-binding protein
MKRITIILIGALLTLCGTAAIAQEYVPTPVTVSKEKVKLNGKVYLSHVVLERQTLYGISAAYGVKVDDIYEANPSLRETGLQKNAIILIPYKEGVQEEAPAAGAAYTEHTVKWYEDIEDIARRYNVSVKDIMDLNKLSSKKLSTRQVLKIPVTPVKEIPGTEAGDDGKNTEETAGEPVVETVEPVVSEEPVKEEQPEVVYSGPVIAPKEVVNASLVLPFHASGNTSELNMDFYSGVLMAMKDLEAQGVKVNLQVYDLMAGIPPIDALTSSDFVLGPVASRDLEAILQRVEGKVHVISPLDQKAANLAANYTSFIQAPTPVDNQYDDLGLWVKEDSREGDKIILITEKGATNVTAAVSIRSALARQELTYDIVNYAIMEGRGIPDILNNLMVKGGVNRVVVASESEAFTSDVVLNLGIMRGKGFDVVMYAPSKVRTFDTIEGSAYHDLSLHISTSYFVDYSSPEVNRFVRAYRALFKTEPSQFAFQGYDTAMHFVTWVAKYGNGWNFMLEHSRSKGLHTDFEFDADEAGNSQNKAVRRIIYRPDYTTTLE